MSWRALKWVRRRPSSGGTLSRTAVQPQTFTEETTRPVPAEHSARNRAAGIDAGDEISSRQPRIAPGMPHMSVDERERLPHWDQRVPGRNRAGWLRYIDRKPSFTPLTTGESGPPRTKQISKFRTSPGQAGHHGSDATAHHACNFLIGKILIFPKEDNLAEVYWQVLDGRPNFLCLHLA